MDGLQTVQVVHEDHNTLFPVLRHGIDQLLEIIFQMQDLVRNVLVLIYAYQLFGHLPEIISEIIGHQSCCQSLGHAQ